MKPKETKVVSIRQSYPDQFEIYEDGSMKAWCKRCNNPEEVPGDRAAKIKKIPEWSSSFTCTPCWKKSKEPEKQDTQDRIAYAQSWNLAVAVLSEKNKFHSDELQHNIEYWQKYFYEKLTNR